MVLITGPNGSGKTSVLEAMHYLCYLRSFRVVTPRHLVYFGQESFFLQATVANGQGDEAEVQAGFSAGKRLVKVNKKLVLSYKELVDHYRVITVTEDDLQLIKGGPDVRRAFLDQIIALHDPGFIKTIREYRNILENRNSLLQQRSSDSEYLKLWTKQLWATSGIIQNRRSTVLSTLAGHTNQLLQDYFDHKLSLGFVYKPKRECNQGLFDDFWIAQRVIFEEEQRYGRSLFGAHLDDFAIEFQHKKSKTYASRGQQKLTILLLKIAQLQNLTIRRGSCLLLLDDFMTDFDKERGEVFINLIERLDGQVVFTSPLQMGPFEQLLLKRGAQLIELRL